MVKSKVEIIQGPNFFCLFLFLPFTATRILREDIDGISMIVATEPTAKVRPKDLFPP